MRIPQHDRCEAWKPSQWLRCMIALCFCGWAACYANPFAFSPAFIRSVQRAAPVASAPSSLTNDLVLVLSMDDGTGTGIAPTSSVGSYTFTNVNSVDFQANGIIGNAPNFKKANSQFLSYAYTPEFCRTGSMFVSFSFFQFPTNAGEFHVYLSCATNGTSSTNIDYQFFKATNNLIVTVGDSGVGNYSTNFLYIETNQFYTVGMVYTQNVGYAFYTNGKLALTFTNKNRVMNGRGPIRIGANNAVTPANFANGMVDELLVGRSVRDATQMSNYDYAARHSIKYPFAGFP